LKLEEFAPAKDLDKGQFLRPADPTEPQEEGLLVVKKARFGFVQEGEAAGAAYTEAALMLDAPAIG
jgi:hypothetical protein